MAENFKRKEWQHELETTPQESITSVVSLYDLIFDKDGETHTETLCHTDYHVRGQCCPQTAQRDRQDCLCPEVRTTDADRR